MVDRKRKHLPKIRIPIWIQLACIFTFITVLISAMFSIIIINKQKEELYKHTVKIGMITLDYFASDARIPLLKNDILHLNSLIKNAKSVDGILYGIVVDHEDQIVAHTNLEKIGSTFTEFNKRMGTVRIGDTDYFQYTSPEGQRALNLKKPVTFKDKKLGEVYVGISIDFIEDLIRKNRSTMIIITASVVLFGLLTSAILGIHFSRPISELVEATEEIGGGNYLHRVSLERKDELGNLATAFNHMSKDLWRKSLMQESFGKYVGSDVLDMIMVDPENMWLKGQRNESTTLFADIRGFVAYYSDAKEPEAVVERLNEFFEIATQIIIKHGGYVDKFIGDAILAVFGVPVNKGNHVERAVRTAVDLQKKLKRGNKNGNKFFTSVGISIDSGTVVSGNIGSQVKMEYTVIGDSVNTASRLNGLAGAGEIIISSNVYEKIKDIIDIKALGSKKIKGIPYPIEVYKVLDIKD